MAIYDFINNTTSVTVNENTNQVTVGKNLISIEPFGTLYLKVTSTSGDLKVFIFSLDDDISLDGVVFTGTLAELHENLTILMYK